MFLGYTIFFSRKGNIFNILKNYYIFKFYPPGFNL